MNKRAWQAVTTGILIFVMTSAAAIWDRPDDSDPRPHQPSARPSKDLKGKVAEMPSRARKAMSSVVGWSPIYDIEKIPVREKDIYKITFDHQGHAAEVLIDQFGEVLNDPAVN
jgi:hypothetical protein